MINDIIKACLNIVFLTEKVRFFS